MTRLILLDRDGVINYDSPDYVKDAHEWLAIPGSLDAIAALKSAGYLVAVCTNQAGIGRGIVAPEALERIHAKLAQLLAERGVALDAVRYCPHRPEDHCRCRKPMPGMLLDVLSELDVAPNDALMVGDRVRDVEAAHAAGVRAVLVRGAGAAEEEQARRLGVAGIDDNLAAFTRRLLEGAPC